MQSYNIANGPEFSDPLAPKPTPSGNTIFLMVDVYETEEGVADHWRMGQQEWPDFAEMTGWLSNCETTILHGSKVVHASAADTGGRVSEGNES